ncbi:hypothetical protein [Streptomyces yangpuensis]|uniref:hypothetical protein n=1 Tax=Streptomyces yangpuensis TaxID=1648182 RepID=UPI0038265A4C
MTKHYFDVAVPIRNTEGLRGVHVFTGRADSGSAAIKGAHEVYDAARAAAEAGREIPRVPGRLGRPRIQARLGTQLARREGRPWKSWYSRLTRQPFEL